MIKTKRSGFETPTYGSIFRRGTTKNPNEKMSPIYPTKKEETKSEADDGGKTGK